MGEIKLVTADTIPCFHCGEQMDAKLSHCPECEATVPHVVTVADLLHNLFGGYVVDVRPGGLVLGRHTKEDDIPMYKGIAAGLLQLTGVMQGGEFILNWRASGVYRDRLFEINGYTDGDYKPLTSLSLKAGTRIFNTNGMRGEDSNLAILVDGDQFVVNRAATIKYLDELEEINNSISPWAGE
jgi:hypothetical protein